MTASSSRLSQEFHRRSADDSNHREPHFLLGMIRIALGWIFLWAFIDKLFGFGFSTPHERSWLNGGSPTAGYLNSVEGPFGDMFHTMAGTAWADVSFMISQLGLGLALLLGIGIRIAAVTGVPLLLLLWATNLPQENNPFMDEHVIYALTLTCLAFTGAGNVLGLGRAWRSVALVRRFPILI